MVSQGAGLSLSWLPQVAYAAILLIVLVPERLASDCFLYIIYFALL